MTDLPLFRAMARRADPDTSHAAAAVVRPELGRIQTAVLAAFSELGPMTARSAERLERFGDYGFSTIRKRISELAAEGFLQVAGTDRSGRAPATIYEVAG